MTSFDDEVLYYQVRQFATIIPGDMTVYERVDKYGISPRESPTQYAVVLAVINHINRDRTIIFLYDGEIVKRTYDSVRAMKRQIDAGKLNFVLVPVR